MGDAKLRYGSEVETEARLHCSPPPPPLTTENNPTPRLRQPRRQLAGVAAYSHFFQIEDALKRGVVEEGGLASNEAGRRCEGYRWC